MAIVQLVRTSPCDGECCGFEFHWSPKIPVIAQIGRAGGFELTGLQVRFLPLNTVRPRKICSSQMNIIADDRDDMKESRPKM